MDCNKRNSLDLDTVDVCSPHYRKKTHDPALPSATSNKDGEWAEYPRSRHDDPREIATFSLPLRTGCIWNKTSEHDPRGATMPVRSPSESHQPSWTLRRGSSPDTYLADADFNSGVVPHFSSEMVDSPPSILRKPSPCTFASIVPSPPPSHASRHPSSPGRGSAVMMHPPHPPPPHASRRPSPGRFATIMQQCLSPAERGPSSWGLRDRGVPTRTTAAAAERVRRGGDSIHSRQGLEALARGFPRLEEWGRIHDQERVGGLGSDEFSFARRLKMRRTTDRSRSASLRSISPAS